MRATEGSAESLSGLWAVLHNDAVMTIRESELHCLRLLALTGDDDLASHLLLKKLRLARIATRGQAPAGLVSINSIVDFRFGEDPPRRCRLVHPSAAWTSECISIASLLGAGLIGLEAGKAILWPDEGGALRPLEVVRVVNPIEPALLRPPPASARAQA